MTNAELIQKIQAEIERLKGQLIRGACAAQIEMETNCKDEAYNEVLSFLGTLEEKSEKPINPSGHRDPCGLRGPSGVDGDKNWYFLDQEIIDWCGKFNPSIREDIQSTAYHFADWQKKQMMEEVVEGWVAVDSDTVGNRRVTFFPKEPVRDLLTEYKYWAATRPNYESVRLNSNAFPNLKWEDEPVKVRIIVIPNTDKK